MITTEELAARLGISASWVRRNVGLFPSAVKVGRTWRFSADADREYLDRQRRAADKIKVEPRNVRAQGQRGPRVK